MKRIVINILLWILCPILLLMGTQAFAATIGDLADWAVVIAMMVVAFVVWIWDERRMNKENEV
jgi:O-antigen/teichoic acid export membrane protein